MCTYTFRSRWTTALILCAAHRPPENVLRPEVFLFQLRHANKLSFHSVNMKTENIQYFRDSPSHPPPLPRLRSSSLWYRILTWRSKLYRFFTAKSQKTHSLSLMKLGDGIEPEWEGWKCYMGWYLENEGRRKTRQEKQKNWIKGEKTGVLNVKLISF